MADMVDMKRSKADMKADAASMPMSAQGEQYPYGICLSLDTDELKKLGIKALPPVGTEYHITAVGKVTRTSQEMAGDERTSMSIQIMFLNLEEEAEEPGEKETAAAENAENRTVKAPLRPKISY